MEHDNYCTSIKYGKPQYLFFKSLKKNMKTL